VHEEIYSKFKVKDMVQGVAKSIRKEVHIFSQYILSKEKMARSRR
jgi:hypothetical protein